MCALCGYDHQLWKRVLRHAYVIGTRLYGWTQWDIEPGLTHLRDSRRADVEVDHIVPRYLGGTNRLENLRTLCGDCHAQVTKQQASTRARTRRELAAVLFTKEPE